MGGAPGKYSLNAPEAVGMVMTVVYYGLLFMTLYVDGEQADVLAKVYPVIVIAVVLTMIVFLFTYVFTFPGIRRSRSWRRCFPGCTGR